MYRTEQLYLSIFLKDTLWKSSQISKSDLQKTTKYTEDNAIEKSSQLTEWSGFKYCKYVKLM